MSDVSYLFLIIGIVSAVLALILDQIKTENELDKVLDEIDKIYIAYELDKITKSQEERKGMLGLAPPNKSFTVVLTVTVECNKVYNESHARVNSFDLINYATQENDEVSSISSIQVDSVVDNNPPTMKILESSNG